MEKFAGFPAGKVRFARIPGPFFSELLPQIDHLGELKVTLYALWRLDRMEGDFRYLTEADFLEDARFIGGLVNLPEVAEAAASTPSASVAGEPDAPVAAEAAASTPPESVAGGADAPVGAEAAASTPPESVAGWPDAPGDAKAAASTPPVSGAGGPDAPVGAEAALKESLARSIERGTFLKANLPHGDGEMCLYFFNSPKGRAAVQAIQAGEWRPTDDARVPVELAPERPNIYHLYEENIGPMTPLLAETLQDAEDTYPAQWIREALRIAVEKNVRNWRYVEAILRRWHERGYDAPETRRDTETSRRQYSAWEED